MEKEDQSPFMEYFGDTPKIRFIDFLITNHFFDFNMTDMAKEAEISYNSLKEFFDEFLEKGIIVKTRRVGKSDMYQYNLENPTARKILQFAWFLMKQDLGVNDEEVNIDIPVNNRKMMPI
ncbi:hypothetical protein CMI42_03530 [Candidatus Pacearchaeota archaeon]|nr:hypothetical protein [Candidatus Pacearchaeota archaeon]|tara:strand:- start:665 stop:1024 length:360 start_codon:yes stop_codon:yes gene_type:complete